MNIEYKVSLTQTELRRIIAAHCGFPLDSKIEITVQIDKQESVDDWIDVPSDWDNLFCPTTYPDGTIIDHMFYDGTIRTRYFSDFTRNWRQEGKGWTIVKYRIAKG